MGKNKRNRAKTRRDLKKQAVNYKGGSCEVCGYNRCLAALTFHHLNPFEKDAGVSNIINTFDWPRIKRELEKCVLLCTNCHSEVHEGLLDGYL